MNRDNVHGIRDDSISRNDAIDAVAYAQDGKDAQRILGQLPSAQPERLTDDDFETIRIHLNAYKEKLCNQQRWKEAEEYQRIIDRFMAFASAQPEREKGEWITKSTNGEMFDCCSVCGYVEWDVPRNFCPNCGADMRGEQDG